MKVEKMEKILGEDLIADLNGASKEKLQSLVADSEEAIAKATRERNALPAYQSAKQAVKDLSEGLKEVRTYQTAKIQYSLVCLRALNGESIGEE